MDQETGQRYHNASWDLVKVAEPGSEHGTQASGVDQALFAVLTWNGIYSGLRTPSARNREGETGRRSNATRHEISFDGRLYTVPPLHRHCIRVPLSAW